MILFAFGSVDSGNVNTGTGSSTGTRETAGLNPENPKGSSERAEFEIRKTLGTSNRKVQRVRSLKIDGKQIFVDVAFNDNLTTNMVKGGIKMDICDVIKAVQESGYDFDQISIEGTFTLVDKFGQESESQVVRATYSRATAERINWSSFLTDNIFDVADSSWVHPALK
jgi:hypothetical protein